jgi:hypothetical protein
MRVRVAILALVAAPVASGCAGLGLAGEGAPAVQTVAAEPPEAGAVVSGLGEAGLPRGECGMILWSLDEDRPVPIFRYISGKTAEMSVGGQLRTLKRIEASGATAFGVYEDQSFAADDGLTVNVTMRFGLGFDGGAYVENGLIAVDTAPGWRTISPSAGISGCRAG